jgi:hypothetical protein
MFEIQDKCVLIILEGYHEKNCHTYLYIHQRIYIDWM